MFLYHLFLRSNMNKSYFRHILFITIFTAYAYLFSLKKPLVDIQFNMFNLFFLLGVIIFIVRNNEKIKKFNFNINYLEVAIYFLIGQSILLAYYYFSYFAGLSFLIKIPGIYLFVKENLFFIAMLFFGLAIYGTNFFKKFKKEIIYATIIGSLFFTITLFLRFKAQFFAKLLAVFSSWILQPFGKVSYSLISDPKLTLNNFSVIIGQPCSGVESIGLFIGIVTLIFAMDWERIKKKLIPPFILFGIIGMYIVSIFRISVLMIVGAYYSPKLALGLFHNNIGWIFFIIYLFIINKIYEKYLRI